MNATLSFLSENWKETCLKPVNKMKPDIATRSDLFFGKTLFFPGVENPALPAPLLPVPLYFRADSRVARVVSRKGPCAGEWRRLHFDPAASLPWPGIRTAHLPGSELEQHTTINPCLYIFTTRHLFKSRSPPPPETIDTFEPPRIMLA